MPIYEFICPIHGRFERIVSLAIFNVVKDGSVCKIKNCYEHCEKVWSRPANIQLAPATRIFINQRTGETQIATSNYEKPPHGFVDKELKGPIERSKFENAEMERAHVVDEIDTVRMQMRRDEHRKQRHSDLRARMNATQKDIDPQTNKEIEYHLDHKAKGMLENAMKDSKARRNVPKKVTEKYLAVNHMNKSSLQDAPQKRK